MIIADAGNHCTTRDQIITNSLVRAYRRHKSLQWIYDQMKDRDVYAWGIFLATYARDGHPEEAYTLFKSLPQHNMVLWNTILTSFLKDDDLSRGISVFHDDMPMFDMVSWNATLAAHTETGHFLTVEEMFLSMPEYDVVSWNTMLTFCGKHGDLRNCTNVFQKMAETNLISWNAILHANALTGHLDSSKKIFDSFPEYNIASFTTMLQVYASSNRVEEAKFLFDQMPELTLQSWTSMLHAFACNGLLYEALETFRSMPERDTVAWISLLNAFVRSGRPISTKSLFDQMPETNTIAWSCLIESSVLAGDWKPALDRFQEMHCRGTSSNEICFLAALVACGYGGLVDRGLQLFASMSSDFGLNPRREHYSAIVGVLARAGELDRAEELSKTMPFEAHGPVWKTMLGASSVHQSGRRYGSLAGQKIVDSAEAFVILSRFQ